MNENEILVPEAEVAPGRYRHYKGREYVVLGLADHYEDVRPGHERLGMAVISGTEDGDPPLGAIVFACSPGAYHYESEHLHGPAVVYRPDYGDKPLTIRPLDEFLAPADGAARYVRIGDA